MEPGWRVMKRTGAAFAAAVGMFFAIMFGMKGYAFAGHPFVTEDPETQGKGNVEAEFSFEYQKAGDGTKTSSLGNAFALGIAPKVDLVIGYGYDFVEVPGGEDTRGMGDVEAQLKTYFNEHKGWMPSLGLKGGVSLPVEEGGQATVLVTVPAEWEFEPFEIYASVGADIGTRLAGNDERTDRVRASMAGSWEVREKLYLVSELLWEKQTSPSADSVLEGMIGAQWEITETMMLDAGIRVGLTEDSPEYTLLVGFTMYFTGEKPSGAPGGGALPRSTK